MTEYAIQIWRCPTCGLLYSPETPDESCRLCREPLERLGEVVRR